MMAEKWDNAIANDQSENFTSLVRWASRWYTRISIYLCTSCACVCVLLLLYRQKITKGFCGLQKRQEVRKEWLEESKKERRDAERSIVAFFRSTMKEVPSLQSNSPYILMEAL